MTEQEKLVELLKAGAENGSTKDEWIVSLLSSIAMSLAIIADEIKGDENE